MNLSRLRFATGLLLAYAVLPGARAADPTGRTYARPEARIGPYTIVLDRIRESRTAVSHFGSAAAGGELRRSLQLDLAVYADDAQSNQGLTLFQINSVTAAVGARLVEIPYTGGMLESPGDPAAVRVFLYAQSFPASAREIRSIQGDIVAYERAGPVDLEIPLANRTFPFSVEQKGVRVQVQELQQEGVWTRIVLTVDAPSAAVLLNTLQDGTYGISLLDERGRPGVSNGCRMEQPRPNAAEYRAAFERLRGVPTTLRIRLAYRGGARRVFPWRLNRVALPSRPGAAREPAGPNRKAGAPGTDLPTEKR